MTAATAGDCFGSAAYPVLVPKTTIAIDVAAWFLMLLILTNALPFWHKAAQLSYAGLSSAGSGLLGGWNRVCFHTGYRAADVLFKDAVFTAALGRLATTIAASLGLQVPGIPLVG
jgi:hypothetical protein